ncbi:hypothetical protein ACE1CI_16440 [Aerosakkonemataceae cyanobacterium BLCC-F50]|uniref:Uncharacterized protein n=1 Tax=Floridaenema flaviceps BLCC-F50 TaxID=3153642 RepID=A0ABV4XU88_9CYAN
MDNKEKIYTLFIAISDLISLTYSITEFGIQLNNCETKKLLFELLNEGREYYNKQIELAPAKYAIEHYLGKLEDNNLDLIYPLWFTFNLAFSKYLLVKQNVYYSEYERDTRLDIAYIKYQAVRKSENSVTSSWEKIKSEVETKLGFFDS